MEQKGQRIGPKVPYRTQRRGEQGEEQRRAAKGAHQGVNAQLSLGSVQAEQEQRRRGAQTVAPVQHPGEPGQAKTEGAKQIVGHPDGQPQQDRLEKHPQLLVHKVPHIIPAAAAAALPGPRTAPHRRASRSFRPPAARRPPGRAGRCADPPP